MCGIGGYKAWGEARPSIEVIRTLLLANEIRGKDAAGLAFIEGEQILLTKQEGPATKLVELIDGTPGYWKRIQTSHTVLTHARASTKGTEKVNANNHPVAFDNWVVVHNGQISNDDDLFKYYKKDRGDREVDTVAIPMVLGQGQDVKDSLKYLTLLSGNATFAAWPAYEPRSLILGRLGINDLYLFLFPAEKLLIFSSTSSIWKVLPTLNFGALKFINFVKLADDRLVLFTEDEFSKLYEVKRRPFFYRQQIGYVAPYTIRQSSESQQSTDTTSTIGSSALSLDQKTLFSWATQDHFPFKPVPNFEKLGNDFGKSHVWEEHSLVAAKSKFTKNPHLVSLRIPTVWGVWTLTKDDTRSFLPNKEVRRFHSKNFQVIWWEDDGAKNLLNGTQILEILTMKQPGNEKQSDGFYAKKTWVCPNCGIVDFPLMWKDRHGKCDFCQITSTFPKDKEESG